MAHLLVLEALCPTWPAYIDIIMDASSTCSAPSSSNEKLMAIFTKSMRPPPFSSPSSSSTLQERAPHASSEDNLRFECSRMGVNMLMLGRWALRVAPKSKQLEWYVTVPNPLQGAGCSASFRVLDCVPPLPPPLSTAPSASLEGTRVVMFGNSIESSVFIYPMDFSCKPASVAWNVVDTALHATVFADESLARHEEHAAPGKSIEMSPRQEQQKEEGLQREPWVRSVQHELLQSVRWLACSEVSTTTTTGDALPIHGSCGVLVHGPAGVGKTFQLRQLLAELPEVVSVSSSEQHRGNITQHVRLETRYLHVPSLFERSGHPTDAAKAACSIVRPPAASIPAAASGSCKGHQGYFGVMNGYVSSKSLLVVVLDGVDGLSADSEELFVMTAAHALAETLEEQRQDNNGSDDSDGEGDDVARRGSAVVVIGVTSNIAAIHPILCSSRALMSRVIEATPPSVPLRRSLLQQHCRPRVVPAVVMAAWLEMTAGWSVPKMLDHVAHEANVASLLDEVAGCTTHHTHGSLMSAMIGVDELVDTIERLLLFPFRHRKSLARSGVVCPKGALIVGPSGAGKTALLAALHSELRFPPRPSSSMVGAQPLVAGREDGNQSPKGRQLHVVMVDALSLLHKEVGRSEKNIQALLAEARASAPSVVFLDNLDAIAPPRGKNTRETNITADRTLSTLLVELDGVRDHHDAEVLVVASAPSVDALDAAMVRPGRLDLHLELQLPTVDVMTQLIVERLFSSNVLRLEDGVDAAAARATLRNVVVESGASVGRSLTYADGVAAVRAVALHSLGKSDASASPVVVPLRDLVDVVREALTQH
jgi:ATP-dependent 26S proteasome regulatory subunit